jgi:hypothetical protein
VVPYDFLVLTPGLQDQTKAKLAGRGDEADKEEEGELKGLFTVANETEEVDVKAFVQGRLEQGGGLDSVVVFGSSLRALTTIRGLLDLGVAPAAVRWAHPRSEGDAAWCAGDEAVHDRVSRALQTLGVRVYPGVHLTSLRQEGGAVTGAVFRNTLVKKAGEADKLTVACSAFLSCSEQRDVDGAVFRALTKNSLVYDGRMVVDATFRTADPNVYAAGSVAKFSRRYGRTLTMEHFNSRELGQTLAEAVLQAVDPAGDAAALESEAFAPPALGEVPQVRAGLLPGGLHYFHANKPSLRTAETPNVLVTSHEDRRTRLEFDDLDILTSISYVGTTAVQANNLVHLVGLPSSYCNRVVYRYSQETIPDLITFLQGTWATALYHENFQELRADIKLDVAASGDLSGLIEKFAAWRKEANPDPTRVMQLVEQELPAAVKDSIQIQLLQFLELHSNHLPGYVVPPS